MKEQSATKSRSKVVLTLDDELEKALAVLEAAGIDPSSAVKQALSEFSKKTRHGNKKNMPRVGV